MGAPVEQNEPPREGQAIVAQIQQELAVGGQMSDDTWQRYMRLVNDLPEDDLRLVIEMLGRTAPTVPPVTPPAGQ